jgi:hypothetical protein
VLLEAELSAEEVGIEGVEADWIVTCSDRGNKWLYSGPSLG